MVDNVEQLEAGQHVRYITLVNEKPCFKKGGLFVATFDDKLKLQNGNFYWFVKLHHYSTPAPMTTTEDTMTESAPVLIFKTLVFRKIPSEFSFRLELESQRMENEDLQVENDELEADLNDKAKAITDLSSLVSNLRDIVAKQYTVIQELYNKQAPSGSANLVMQSGGGPSDLTSLVSNTSTTSSSATSSSSFTSSSTFSNAPVPDIVASTSATAARTALDNDTSSILSASSTASSYTTYTSASKISAVNKRIRQRRHEYLKKVHDPDVAFKSFFSSHFDLLQQIVSDASSALQLVAPASAASTDDSTSLDSANSSSSTDTDDQQYYEISRM
jgi:hypothetical protein